MLRNTYRLICLSVCAILALGVTSAPATVIYSDISGATVDFTSISEGSPTGDPEPMYGQPISVIDTLVFPTTASFSASSLDGLGSDSTAGKLSFVVKAKPNVSITALNVFEGGVTNLNSPFGGDAFTNVVAFATVKVLEIGNSPVVLPATQSFVTTSPSGGVYQLSVIGGSSYTTGWSGSLSFPLPLGTTKALVTLDNDLFATTLGTGSGAYIDKQIFSLDVETVVPEPTTLLLGFVAFMGMATARRN